MNTITVCVIAVCMTVIECYALHLGIDGTVMQVVIAALCGLGGWHLNNAVKKPNKTSPDTPEK